MMLACQGGILVRDSSGQVLAAMSAAAFASRVTLEDMAAEFLPVLRRHAGERWRHSNGLAVRFEEQHAIGSQSTERLPDVVGVGADSVRNVDG